MKPVTIRFAHVDAAGIVFYARYFELLSRAFPDSPLASPPFGMRSEFLRPNRLGDQVQIECKEEGESWSYSGKMDDVEYFRISSLATGDLVSAGDREPELTDFIAGPEVVREWAVDASGRMPLSRYFELVSETVELWFESVLDLPFKKLHTATNLRVPTVRFTTHCRAMPRLGEEITIQMRPVSLGRASVTFRSWLMRGYEWLVDTEQVIVFVEPTRDGFRSTPIPENFRERIAARMTATAQTPGSRNVAP